MYRTIFTLVAIGLLVTTAQKMTMAADERGTSTLRIKTLDASTGKSVPLTNITIYGPRNLQAVANYSGTADFIALPAGEYSLEIRRYGYKSTKIARIELADGETIALDVHLVPTGLKIIATVTAQNTPKASTRTVRSDDAPSQLNNSLLSALNSLPGITVGPGFAPSIRGRPPSETGTTINGVPVSLFGSPPNVGALNADLFSSASIEPSDALGNGGGTIDFETRSPTLAWLGTLRKVGMSNNGADFVASEEGTAGLVGVSYTYAQRTNPDPLDGLTYLDTSGLDYPHPAADMVRGNAVEIRYPFSQDNVLFASGVSIDATQPLVCRDFTGRVPCGYGPTNVQRTRLRSIQLRDTSRIGSGWLTSTVFSNNTSLDVDQSGFYANGVHEPSTSMEVSHTGGVMLHGGFPLTRRQARNVEFKAQALSQSATSLGNAFGPIEPPVFSRLSFANFVLDAPLATTHRFSSFLSVGGEHWQNDVVNTSAHAGISFSYEMTSHDSVSLETTSRTAVSPTAGFTGVSPANLLQFNCRPNVALGTGPSQATSNSHSLETRLAWRHSAGRWNAQLEIYNQVQTDAPIAAIVRATEIDRSLFSPDYLIQANMAKRNACGSNTPVDFSNLFYTISGVAERAEYQGVNLSAVASPSEHVAVRLSYALTRATAYGAGPLLFGPFSTVIAGDQLPQVPLHTADLAAAVDVGNSGVKALFEASGVSSNNAYNLPGYVTINAGALIPTQHGLLAITATNLTNRYPGPFATAAGAVSLRMAGGAFPTIAQPLSPRAFSVGYRFHVGPPELQPTFDVDEAQFEPDYSGVGGGSFGIPTYSGKPPVRPFDINPQSPGCGPEDLRTAQRILAALKSYVGRIERAKTADGYPQTFPPEPVDALILEYSRVGQSYAVLVSTSAADTSHLNADILPLDDCAFLYAVYRPQAQLSDLYMTPKSGIWTGPGFVGGVLLAYMPAVGLYPPPTAFEDSKPVPPHPKIENAHFYDYLDPESARPSAPFAIRNGADCSPEIEPAAADVLNMLRAYAHAYFDLHQHPANPPGLRIIAHRSSGGTWLEIRSEDLEALSNLTPCMNVFEMSRKAIQEAGYSGELPPELSYAPPFGFYIVDR